MNSQKPYTKRWPGRLALATAAVALLASCHSIGRQDFTARAPADDESVFIIRLRPSLFRASFFPGSVEDNKFSQSTIRFAAVYGSAVDGYLVGRGSAGDTLALTQMSVVGDGDAWRGVRFVPCDTNRTVVFKVPKGKVIYLGDFDYALKGNRLMVRYDNDLEAVKQYIDEHYPALQGRVEPWDYRLMQTTKACSGGTIYIPVYIPSGKR